MIKLTQLPSESDATFAKRVALMQSILSRPLLKDGNKHRPRGVLYGL